jgi:hypothetical protein
VSQPDPHAFLLTRRKDDLSSLLKRWEDKGGHPKAIAEAMADMRAFAHVGKWIRQMHKAVRCGAKK